MNANSEHALWKRAEIVGISTAYGIELIVEVIFTGDAYRVERFIIDPFVSDVFPLEWDIDNEDFDSLCKRLYKTYVGHFIDFNLSECPTHCRYVEGSSKKFSMDFVYVPLKEQIKLI